MKKRFYTQLKGKVILVSVAGFVALAVIHFAISYAFEKMNNNIDQLAKPNEKLVMVNHLFRDVSQMNHLQRQKTVLGKKDPSVAFIKESDAVYVILDSLLALFERDTLQTSRINEINRLLIQREKLFFEYLNLQYRQSSDPGVNTILERLTQRVNSKEDVDTIIKYESITTTKTISSDTIKKSRPGFFRRLFGKGASSGFPEIVENETINKDVKVVIDTIPNSEMDSIMTVFESSLDSLHKTQMRQSDKLLQKELMLLKANSEIIHQIIDIINSVEQEEMTRVNESALSAFGTTRKTIRCLNYIVFIFVSVSAVLVLLIIVDITRSNKYRSQLEIANSNTRKEAQAKQRFLSNMSHEIRTPLQSIYGYAEHARNNPDEKINLDAIFFSAEHLLNIVNEVLDYSKFTSGKVILDNAPFNPFTEISNVVLSMQTLAGKKALQILFEPLGADDLFVIGDAYRLKQIVYNLLGNAIKFTDSGTVSVSVIANKNEDEATLEIKVSDTGIGISSDCISSIFEEFGQSHPSISAHYGGTGLGLTIVKKLVDIHKGQINVESTPGKGSCFTVAISYKIVLNENIKHSSNCLKLVHKPGLVWFADDDPLILNLGSAIIKKHNIHCQIFNSGEALLEAFENIKPDIIFLDMRMPGLSGSEVLNKIREGCCYPVKCFALTAQALPTEQNDIMCSGFDGLIIKPFKESDLLEAIDVSFDKKNKGPLLNIENLEKMSGSREVTINILKCFLDESRKDLGQIDKELLMNNCSGLSLLIHRMAGRAGQLGAMDYAMQLRIIERELNNGINEDTIIEKVSGVVVKGSLLLSELELLIDKYSEPVSS